MRKRWGGWMALVLLLHGVLLAVWLWARTESPVANTQVVQVVNSVSPQQESSPANHTASSSSMNAPPQGQSSSNINVPPPALPEHEKNLPSTAANKAANQAEHGVSNDAASNAQASTKTGASEGAAKQSVSSAFAGAQSSSEGGSVQRHEAVDCQATIKSAQPGAGTNVAVKAVRMANGQAQFVALRNAASDAAQYLTEIKAAVGRVQFKHHAPECVGVVVYVTVRVE